MKRTVLLSITVASFLHLPAQQNMLSGKYTKEELKAVLIPQSKWTPFPKLNDRTGWSKADAGMMQAFLKATYLSKAV